MYDIQSQKWKALLFLRPHKGEDMRVESFKINGNWLSEIEDRILGGKNSMCQAWAMRDHNAVDTMQYIAGT
jgi:hypothetical protein